MEELAEEDSKGDVVIKYFNSKMDYFPWEIAKQQKF
jgi:hypothetical protein